MIAFSVGVIIGAVTAFVACFLWALRAMDPRQGE